MNEAELLGKKLRQRKRKKKKRVNGEVRTTKGLIWKTLNVPGLDLRNGAEEDEELDSIAASESADQSLYLEEFVHVLCVASFLLFLSVYKFLCVTQRICLVL